MPNTITIADLAEELRRRREKDKLSLRDLEELTGVSAATLSRIERGRTPDLPVVAKLAEWLGLSIQTGGKPSKTGQSDEDLKRTIEVHLRANKKLPSHVARSIANSFDVVMRVEMERAAKKKV
jgi:transcriptional regulator with XRE-family HTH domain